MDNSNQNPNPFLPPSPVDQPTSFNPPIAPVESPFTQTPTPPPPPPSLPTPAPAPEPTYNPMIPTSQDTQPLPSSVESAPTDLSHLIDPSMNVNAGNPPAYTPPISSQPETLVVPSGEPDVSVTATESHSKIPVWVMAIGGVLLLAVAGASAYFILGLGKTDPVTSLPATTQAPGLQPPPQQIPVATPIPAPSIAPAQTSDSFGQLNSTSSGTPKSAADLLKSRAK